MNYKFHIEPRDLLFMRDARPIGASDAGLGANWPRPDQIWSAFINAFHRRWPELQTDWEHNHTKRSDEKNKDSSCRFGALKTVGPFPVAGERLFLPCPLDLSAEKGGDGKITLTPMSLCDAEGTNLPMPLSKTLASRKLGKDEAPKWISAANYIDYLEGKAFSPDEHRLYDVERNIGIAIDPVTHSTVDGKFYQAEYLRLAPDVRLAVEASCEITGAGRAIVDVFRKIAPLLQFVYKRPHSCLTVEREGKS